EPASAWKETWHREGAYCQPGGLRHARSFFRIIEQRLDGLAGPGHFFDLLADDITVDYVVTVPGYPRQVEGRAAVAELYSPYGTMIILDRCFDLAVYYDSTKGVV